MGITGIVRVKENRIIEAYRNPFANEIIIGKVSDYLNVGFEIINSIGQVFLMNKKSINSCTNGKSKGGIIYDFTFYCFKNHKLAH